MRRDRSGAQEQSSFNWIEVVAVPLAVGLMEGQFGVLAFIIGSLLFTGKSDALLLVEGSVILLTWSLYWWAMLSKRVIQPRLGEQRANQAYLPALLVTFVIVLGIHPAFVVSFPQLAFSGALSTWLWRRGMVREEKSTQERTMLTTFQVGFVVLLALLSFAIFSPQPIYEALLDLLTYVLPIYCLSGFVAISFSHLDALKKAQVRSALKGSRAYPTRAWMLLLFLMVAIAVSAITLTIAAFQPMVETLSPLVNALHALYNWLLSLLTPQPPLPPRRLKRPPGPGVSVYLHAHKPDANPLAAGLQVILVAGMILLALFVLLLLLWVIRRILRNNRAIDEDEIREALAIRSVLRTRKQKRQRIARIGLEPLDATSTRARYREFLQAMARRGGDERRRQDNETPVEYQTRLLTLLEHVSQEEAQKEDTPADAAIIDELTRAYALERYGGKRTEQGQQSYLRRWVPLLARRLTSKK